jgi:hypothetical protein
MTAASGEIQVPIITRATASDVTDGTPLTNGAARTLKTITLYNKVVNATLEEEELMQWTPDTAAAFWASAGDAIVNAAETQVLTDYMAGTAYKTYTLTAGQQNFTDDGTDAEIRANLKVLTGALGAVKSVTGQAPNDEYVIVLPSVVVGGSEADAFTNVFTNLQMQSQLEWDGDLNAYRWAGVPVYGANSSATGWGKSDGGTAGIVAHRDSMCAVFPRLRIVPPYDNDSGLVQTTMKGAYGSGLLNTGTSTGTWAEIMNSST